MFARVSVYDIPGERSGDAAAAFTSALDQISACSGFVEGFFLVDPDEHRATAVTFWTSQAALDASAVTASRLRTEAAHAVDGTVVSTQHYEVAAHVEKARGATG